MSVNRSRRGASRSRRSCGWLLNAACAWLALAGFACAPDGERDALAREADPHEARIADQAARGCVRRPRTLVSITPPASTTGELEGPIRYEVKLLNNDSPACGSSSFTLVAGSIEEGLEWLDWTDADVEPGATGTLTMTVQGEASLEPGTYTLPFHVVRLGDQSDLPGTPGSAQYLVAAQPGCAVRARSELLVRDLSVVEDARRTTTLGSSPGAWTFTGLIEAAAPAPTMAPLMVEQLFQSFAAEQTINGFSVPSRTDTQRFLLEPWPKTRDGMLDLTRVPLRLLAIVNRMDLRNLEAGHAGEAAFVFGMFNPADFAPGAPSRRVREVDFTVVLEYRLPARTTDDVVAWARAWHQLGSMPFPSPAYSAALEALTTRITARGAAPGQVNGSALARVRTNDGKLEGPGNWELREFALSPETGLLAPQSPRLTPDASLRDAERLARFVNQNEASILREQHEVPESFEDAAFLSGAVPNNLLPWDAPGIASPEARHRFALNTCDGCHGVETDTDRKHVASRIAGELALLSPFLMGETVIDPISGASRSFGELSRRRADLEAIVCGTDVVAAASARPTVSGAPPAAPQQATWEERQRFLSRGISRTH